MHKSCHGKLAPFPGSPLALMKNKNRGEPGIDLHVIPQHDAFPFETSCTHVKTNMHHFDLRLIAISVVIKSDVLGNFTLKMSNYSL